MSQVTRSRTWREELDSLMEDSGIRYTSDSFSTPASDPKQSEFKSDTSFETERKETENVKDQIKGFAKAWGDLLLDLSRGCRDIVQQSFVTKDSYIVQKLGRSVAKISDRLSFMNEFLPEDRDPVHAWPVILFVFILALAALNVNTTQDSSIPVVKKMHIHPPSASRILLPDGRQMAYRVQGVPADRARFTVISPHAFLSSRLAGIPGVSESLLVEFGLRLVAYDLPGFGESNPHPVRNLNSSAHDMLYLADAVGVGGSFWVLGYSSAAMHAWAALRYISNRVAGAAMIAPMINPYEPGMTKKEMSMTWEKWDRRRRMMFYLAKRFPSFLSYYYRRSFLSGKHGEIEKWMSISLGERDKAVIQRRTFQEHWLRDVEESVQQGRAKPFVEEAVLQVSDWGFSLEDLQMRRKCKGNGILPWLKSIYGQAECELTGFQGPIHIWQGMDDQVVPPSMAEYISRILPGAILHWLENDGHFSYFFFCDECHREILLTLFGNPKGPLDSHQ
ncbi:hypothetical protein Nepgr_024958 [Nepenthes gracilis]|uniref:AB hydrolase-1 domain-containing protein n=1 Tax=Nepenthes gracilis TaxID=150966 RepID=A0AAD3Y0K9_NEPGR|nr:hypothetical protein Nepgr_024958 [Nepenthes gracilis]